MPCGGEGIVRVGLLVLLDRELESVFADVTPESLWSVVLFGPAEASRGNLPRADRVAHDVDVVVGHPADGSTKSHDGEYGGIL